MRQLRWVLAGGGSALTLALLSAGSASADHGRNLWAGQWTTNTGGAAFRLMDASEIANAKQERGAPELVNKLPCKTGPQVLPGRIRQREGDHLRHANEGQRSLA